VRILLALGIVAGGVLAASLLGGARGGAAAALGIVVLRFALRLVPVYAHRAFQRGQYGQALWLWRCLGPLVVSRTWLTAIRVSIAGCRMARGEYAAGMAELGRIAPEGLLPSVRAAWLNNAAYARIRSAGNARQALSEIDEAIKLSPDVAGYYHTRGLVLLALGRAEDAIALLDDLWRRLEESPPPLLEAERCYDLGCAWRDKGEVDYAHDYFDRARRVAPESTWGRQAGARLALGTSRPSG
jgi:tetratricopeptide (TPR) repeat protein